MYTFKRTERNRGVAEEYETRAMLYLLNNKKELDFFLVDTFNDISGSNASFKYIVDVQAKGYKSLLPSDIGKSLITLFQNHMSNIKFEKYILYCKYIDSNYIISKSQVKNTINIYTINDFVEKKKFSIIDSLKNQYNGIQNDNDYDNIHENIIKDFFERLIFIVDSSLRSDLIKACIDLKSIKLMDNKKLDAIFKDISTKREELKRINIEGLKIRKAMECLEYNKYLERKTIESLILSRVIGYDIFKDIQFFSPSFVYIIRNLDDEKIKDLIIRVNSDISKAYFDINNPKPFFECIDFIMEKLKNTNNVEDIYSQYVLSVKKKPKFLTELSTKYLISMIVDSVNMRG